MQQSLRDRLIEMDCDGKIEDPWRRAFLYLCYCDLPERQKEDAFALWDKWGRKIVSFGWRVSDLKNLLPVIRGREIEKVNMADISFDDGGKAYMRPVVDGPSIWQEKGRRG